MKKMDMHYLYEHRLSETIKNFENKKIIRAETCCPILWLVFNDDTEVFISWRTDEYSDDWIINTSRDDIDDLTLDSLGAITRKEYLQNKREEEAKEEKRAWEKARDLYFKYRKKYDVRK